ncbi:ATP-binding protein [Streptomyces sp. NPDC018693]|uniref:ATP-binding protein n=1 Tax=unclassified Streptomyces TaxID=2593676 RepID=UPI0037988527
MNEKTTQLISPLRNFSVQLPTTPRGARLARELAMEQLRYWRFELDPARQIVAELTANAVTHGGVPGRDFLLLMYVIGDTLRIEVTDTRSDRLPHPQTPPPTAESGRGLLLVEALATRWGTTPGPHPRKTTWAEVPARPAPGEPCSGERGGLPKGPRERKNPYQAPPLPPATQTHPRG